MYMLLAKSIFVCLMPIKYLYCIVNKANSFGTEALFLDLDLSIQMAKFHLICMINVII